MVRRSTFNRYDRRISPIGALPGSSANATRPSPPLAVCESGCVWAGSGPVLAWSGPVMDLDDLSDLSDLSGSDEATDERVASMQAAAAAAQLATQLASSGDDAQGGASASGAEEHHPRPKPVAAQQDFGAGLQPLPSSAQLYYLASKAKEAKRGVGPSSAERRRIRQEQACEEGGLLAKKRKEHETLVSAAKQVH
jgi:hypothetical protein|eukprot:COSAG01_NODE_5352_length_4315_cov_51.182638_2_plen_195_part_00